MIKNMNYVSREVLYLCGELKTKLLKIRHSLLLTQLFVKKMVDKKYIYIFTNTHSKDVVKIGKTDKYPEVRAEQLNKQTGTIGKYEVAWFKEVPDNDIAEKIVHYGLREFNIGKEYFDISSGFAIEMCNNIVTSYFDSLEEQKQNTKSGYETIIKGLKIALKYATEVENSVSISQRIKQYEDRLQKLQS